MRSTRPPRHSTTGSSGAAATLAAICLALAGCAAGESPTGSSAVRVSSGGSSPVPGGPVSASLALPTGESRTILARRADDLTNPLIKALPLASRVQPAVTVTEAARTEVAAPEGIWLITRPQVAPQDPNWAVIHEYGELMLLSSDRRRILASYPFEGVPPEWLLLTDEAVYCGRGGDGGLPDAMVARLTRSQDDLQVRFGAPSPDGGTAVRAESLGARPGNWLAEPRLTSHAAPPTVRDGRLVFEAAEGEPRLVLDAATLAVRD